MGVIAVAIGDEQHRARIVRALASAGYAPAEALDPEETLRLLFDLRPEALIVDYGITRMEGSNLLHALRAATDVPIILLGPDPHDGLAVELLDAGADDVADYDVDTGELVARLRAALRRSRRQPSEPDSQMVVRTGDLVIDRGAQTVTKRGQLITLTRTEFRLLDALAARAGQLAPHRFLLTTVWGESFGDDTHYLRVYVGYLRNKLEDDPAHPRYIVNEWGMGYRLVEYAPRDTPAGAQASGDREADASPPARVSRRRRRR